jgi:hypothetical protein
MLDEAARTLGVTTANWLDAPYNRSGFRHVPDLVRTAPIRRGAGPVRELERAERNVGDIRFEFEGATVTIHEICRPPTRTASSSCRTAPSSRSAISTGWRRPTRTC